VLTFNRGYKPSSLFLAIDSPGNLSSLKEITTKDSSTQPLLHERTGAFAVPSDQQGNHS
jgi:hypothetical protein